MRPQPGVFNAGVSMPPFTNEQRARFLMLVNDRPGQGPMGDCQMWTSHTLKTGGYGQFYHSRSHPALRAHRVAYFLGKGEDPGSSDVLHSCDMRLCCNPEHLSLGTRAQNQADMAAKGRAAKGLRVSGAKLSDDDVRIISDKIENRELTWETAATQYGMSKGGLWQSIMECHKGVATRPRRQRRKMNYPTRAMAEQVKQDRLSGMVLADIELKHGLTSFTVRAILEGRLKRYRD